MIHPPDGRRCGIIHFYLFVVCALIFLVALSEKIRTPGCPVRVFIYAAMWFLFFNFSPSRPLSAGAVSVFGFIVVLYAFLLLRSRGFGGWADCHDDGVFIISPMALLWGQPKMTMSSWNDLWNTAMTLTSTGDWRTGWRSIMPII